MIKRTSPATDWIAAATQDHFTREAWIAATWLGSTSDWAYLGAADEVILTDIYGAGEDPQRKVLVRVELGREFVRIHVVDDGPGFDPSGTPDPTLPENLEREFGRGLFVIRHLVDDVVFNEKGNGICLTLRAG